MIDIQSEGIDGKKLITIPIQINETIVGEVRDRNIGMSISSRSSGQDIGRVILGLFTLRIGEIGVELYHDILIVDPEVVNI